MRLNEYVRRELLEVLLYGLLGAFVLILPLLFGFVRKGFSESFIVGEPIKFGTYLASFGIYLPFILISLLYIFIPLMKLVELNAKEHPAVKRAKYFITRIFTVSNIHAPDENGFFYFLSEETGNKGKKNWMRWSLNPLRLIVVSAIIFGILGLVILGNPQWAGAGVQIQSQQISLGSDIAFNSLIPSFSENGTILFILSVLQGIVAFFISRTNLDRRSKLYLFFGLSFILCFFTGLLFGGLHNIVYGASYVKFISTVIFGVVGSLLTVITGSFIPWFMYHFMNNLFVTLRVVVDSNSDVYFIAILSLVLLTVSWIGIELLTKKKNSNPQGF